MVTPTPNVIRLIIRVTVFFYLFSVVIDRTKTVILRVIHVFFCLFSLVINRTTNNVSHVSTCPLRTKSTACVDDGHPRLSNSPSKFAPDIVGSVSGPVSFWYSHSPLKGITGTVKIWGLRKKVELWFWSLKKEKKIPTNLVVAYNSYSVIFYILLLMCENYHMKQSWRINYIQQTIHFLCKISHTIS